MSENMGSIYYEVEADTSKLVNSSKDVDRATAEMERSFARSDKSAQKNQRSIDGMGRASASAAPKMTRLAEGVKRANAEANLGVAAFGGLNRVLLSMVGGALFGRLVDHLASFQQRMLEVQAVSQATGAQFKALESQARELGGTTVFSAQQAAEAQGFLAQAGLSVNQILSATPDVLKLAIAGSLDLGSAATIAAGALNGFGLEVSQLARVNDVLAKAAADSNTDVQDLGGALSYAAPVARQAGLSIETTVAAIETLGDATIKGSRAGTGMVGVIRQLSKITPMAAKALAKYGLSTSDLNITTHGLVPVLKTLAAANLSTSDTFQIFGSEAGVAAGALLASVDKIEEYKKGLADAAGTSQEMADILNSGLTASLKGLHSAASEAALQLMDGGLGGALKGLIVTTGGVISAYNGMLPEFAKSNDLTEDQETAIAGLSQAIGVFTTLVGTRMVVALGAATSAKLASYKASLDSAKVAAAEAKAEQLAAEQLLRRTAAELQAARVIQARALADAKATAGTNAHALALDHLAASAARATAAEEANAAAQNAVAAASTRAAAASRKASLAMSLLGGPIGIAAIAIAGVTYALYQFTKSQDVASGSVKNFREEADKTSPSLDALSKKFKELGQAQREQVLDSQFLNVGDWTSQMFGQLDKINAKIKGFGETAYSQFTRARNSGTSMVDALDSLISKGLVPKNARSELLDLIANYESVNKKLEKQQDILREIKKINDEMARDRKAQEGGGGGGGGSSADDPNAEKALQKLRDELALIKKIGVERAKLKAVQSLGDEASESQKTEAASLANQVYWLKKAQDAHKSDAEYIKKLNESTKEAALSGEALAAAKAKASLSKWATPEEIAQVEQLAKAQYKLEEAKKQRDKLKQKPRTAWDDITGNPQPLSGGVFDDQYARYEAEGKKEEKRYADSLEKLQEYEQAKLDIGRSYQDAEAELFQQHAQRMQQINDAKNQILLTSSENAFAAMAGAVAAFGGEASSAYKTLFAISKGFAIASAALNLYSAISQAMADPTALTPAQKFANMAAIGSAGAALATQIASVTYAGGRQYGGPVAPNKMYRVNENGRPEVFKAANGQQFMLPNTRGEVISHRNASAGDTSITMAAPTQAKVTIINQFQSDGTARTQAPAGMEAMGKEIQAVVDRHINQKLKTELRPGGMLYRSKRNG